MQFHSAASFSGHKGSIYTIERISGGQFVTAGSDGVLALWTADDPDNGEMLAKVPAVVYSLLRLNDSLLLAGTAHGQVHVIDLDEKREVRILQYHDSPVFRMAFWEQQQCLFTLAGNGQVQVYDAQLNPLKSFSVAEGKLRAIAFYEDYFVVGTSEGKIHVFSQAFELLHSYQAHREGFGINSLAIIGNRLLSGARDAHLVHSDPVSGVILAAVPVHNYAIYRIAENPFDPSVFATASRDKTVKIWRASDLSLVQRLDLEAGGHRNSVNDAVWLSASLLVSTGDDRTAIAWERR